jgi:hypothetical protein
MPTTETTQLVLSTIGDGEFSPLDLLAELKKQNIDESTAKEAISYLINNHEIDMTENRRLRALEFAS